MIKKFLPLLLSLIGVGAGVGAGIFLRPAETGNMAESVNDATLEARSEGADAEKPTKDADHTGGQGAKVKTASSGLNLAKGESHDDALAESEYVKMNNQFVVPIVSDERVVAMVVLALSIEVPTGYSDAVFRREPKMRDSFLQVLFDHANMGGFDGSFTSAQVLGQLRTALREVAQKDLGEEVVRDVLIVEIARQDY